ncbi:MAG: type II secretion system minor pseudopilin GspK [Pseudomonas sp.]
MKRRAQRGVALITVLLVVAIVTVVCAGLIARQQLAIRATANQLQARQAWHYALGGEALAQAILSRDLQASGDPRSSTDHLLEAWAKPLPVFLIEQGEIAVRIEDLAGRFNLNSLVRNEQRNDQAVARFRRLLRNLEIQQPYAERLVDWLDADQQADGESGAEDSQYLLLQPAYRPANRRLEDVSELRLLLGMSEADYRRLAPHVSALPSDAALNVNTASALVLSCLSENLTPDTAQALIGARGREGFRDMASFTKQPVLGDSVPAEGLDVKSDYFRVISEVRLAERRQVLLSTLQRDAKGRVRVLQRDLGQPAFLPAPATQEQKE